MVEVALSMDMNLSVPYYSQKEEGVSSRYGHKACGLTSLRMVLAYYNHPMGVEELSNMATQIGAYEEKQGWVHAGLLNIAREFRLKGFRINLGMLEDEDLVRSGLVLAREGTSRKEFESFTKTFETAKEHGALNAVSELLNHKIPVIASMKDSYAQTTASHLVVIRGLEDGKYIINDPWENGESFRMDINEFEKEWTKRIIVIYKNQPF